MYVSDLVKASISFIMSETFIGVVRYSLSRKFYLVKIINKYETGDMKAHVWFLLLTVPYIAQKYK
jgi:hypothetical protein